MKFFPWRILAPWVLTSVLKMKGDDSNGQEKTHKNNY